MFDLIFKELLGIDYIIVSENEEYEIRYSELNEDGEHLFIPLISHLLFSKGFHPFEVPYRNTGPDTELFPSDGVNGPWNFDLFSSVFYLVSRYEEYEGFTPDAHHRFPPTASILHKTNSFEFPLVNLWVQKLKKVIQNKYPEITFKEPKFRFVSTIDIDSTFQFCEKGLWWSLSGLAKDLAKGKYPDALSRLKTLTGIQNDAFNVYDEMDCFHKKYGTEVLFFFLLGDYAPFDKNIPWKNKKQAHIIKTLNETYSVGIHPSYASNYKEGQLEKEVKRMETITGTKQTMSRQHFIIHSFPKTYQKLVSTGIKADFSMGYTSQYGFRAGIAAPFYFFDLEKEMATDLLLYPFCSMDITPLHYYKISPEQAMEKNRDLLKKVKDVNGLFISLWHNESISGALRWKGDWPKVYFQLLKDAAEMEE